MQAHCGRPSAHNKCREVMRQHHHRVDHLSDPELTCKLNKGVMIDGNKKFSMDKKHRMCMEFFARVLDIFQSSNCNNWIFIPERMSSSEWAEVAELLEVCQLEVKLGDYIAKMLTPNTEYEVLFDILMKPCAEGFNCYPVNFSLTNAEGIKTETNKNLDELKGKGYTEVSIGKFRSPSECECESKSKIEFKMEECNPQVKKGLVVRGVIIRPAAAKCGC